MVPKAPSIPARLPGLVELPGVSQYRLLATWASVAGRLLGPPVPAWLLASALYPHMYPEGDCLARAGQYRLLVIRPLLFSHTRIQRATA